MYCYYYFFFFLCESYYVDRILKQKCVSNLHIMRAPPTCLDIFTVIGVR